MQRVSIFSGLSHPVNRDILRVLVFFTLLMVALPLGSFFAMEKYVMPRLFPDIKYHLMWR